MQAIIIVQLARQQGATVMAMASSPAKREVALRRGADHVLTDGEGGLADEVCKLTQHQGVDVVFDALGLSTLRDCWRATRRKGLVINDGSVSGSVTDLDRLELGKAGSLFLTRPRLADHMADARTVQHRADAIFPAIAEGRLAVDISGRDTLVDVALAHARLEAREQLGMSIVCIRPGA
jgi:NADPH2:quinone reductase